MLTIPYLDLKLTCEINNRKPTYSELLSTKEWFNKRQEIINRDHRCSICDSVETDTVALTNGKWANIEFRPIIGPKEFEESLGAFINAKPNNYNAVFSEKPKWFHVHHKYYILTKLPWEYDNDVFVTMCNLCHNDWHINNTAPVYNEIDNVFVNCNLTVCDRCNGVGFFSEYNHIQNGICFKCQGYKYLEIIGLYQI